ncbi:hypothetical protein HRD84_14380, partial [Enterococcus faecalis]|nr:hypothetical protein [Enterococcus faecalis]
RGKGRRGRRGEGYRKEETRQKKTGKEIEEEEKERKRRKEGGGGEGEGEKREGEQQKKKKKKKKKKTQNTTKLSNTKKSTQKKHEKG